MLYLNFAVLLAGLSSAASSINLRRNNHLKIDFAVSRGSSLLSGINPENPPVWKRGSSAELSLAKMRQSYIATLKFGSQGAEIQVMIDTCTSDTWVIAADELCLSWPTSVNVSSDKFSTFTQRRSKNLGPRQASSEVMKEQNGDSHYNSLSEKTNCTGFGTFDFSKSTSFRFNGTDESHDDFFVQYGIFDSASGSWGTDYIAFGDFNISDCSFGLAGTSTSTSENGILGIGLAGAESTVHYTQSDLGVFEESSSYQYENFPLRLKSTGVIDKVLYSLYLNTANASSGSLLFGAVDHAKYSGQLQTVPIINIRSQLPKPTNFDIVLSSVLLESTSRNISVSNTQIHAYFDSGLTLSYLPQAILDAFVFSLGGALPDDDVSTEIGVTRVDCSYNTTSVKVIFNFSGAEIRVPLSDLIIDYESQCYLGLSNNFIPKVTKSVSYAILGDNFLRNAYIVYDLEDYEISLAQARYSNSEDIEVVSSSVPSAVKAAGYSATSFTTSVTFNSESFTEVLSSSEFNTGSTSINSKSSSTSSTSSTSSPSGSKKSTASKMECFKESVFFAIIVACGILIL